MQQYDNWRKWRPDIKHGALSHSSELQISLHCFSEYTEIYLNKSVRVGEEKHIKTWKAWHVKLKWFLVHVWKHEGTLVWSSETWYNKCERMSYMCLLVTFWSVCSLLWWLMLQHPWLLNISLRSHNGYNEAQYFKNCVVTDAEYLLCITFWSHLCICVLFQTSRLSQ